MTCKQVAHVEQVSVAQDSFAMLSTAVMTVRCILRGLSWIFSVLSAICSAGG